jgi:uncharacterized membrane protein
MGGSARTFLSGPEQDKIKKAIMNAENDSSGEIRVHIESECHGDVLDRAAYLFKTLGMEKTELRNGVLFYLAANSKKFAILGDKGINKEVPEDFWVNIREIMSAHFKEGDFAAGLSEGIREAGMKLKKHFPHHLEDIDELTDEISFGD